VIGIVAVLVLVTVSVLVTRVGAVALRATGVSTDAFDRVVTGLIERALHRWTDVTVRDHAQLRNLAADHAVRDLLVHDGDWLSWRSLTDLDLTDEGVLVPAIRGSDGDFLAAPTPTTEIRAGDTVLLWREQDLGALDTRPRGPAGDAQHQRGMRQHRCVQAAEQARDEQARAAEHNVHPSGDADDEQPRTVDPDDDRPQRRPDTGRATTPDHRSTSTPGDDRRSTRGR
jgi:hypothetical protein